MGDILCQVVSVATHRQQGRAPTWLNRLICFNIILILTAMDWPPPPLTTIDYPLTAEILLFLIVAATDMEMRAFTNACVDPDLFELLVTGVGPMETAFTLTSRLARGTDGLDGVLHFGIAGAYLYADGSGAEMLDICLAEEEILGDLGICHQDRIEPFIAPELGVSDRFVLDRQLLDSAEHFLKQQSVIWKKGRFITVNSASGTLQRARVLVDQFQGLCENMEGAAVARVCGAYKLPCLELRCISNFVEDRDCGRWELKKACQRAGKTAALVAEYLAAVVAGSGIPLPPIAIKST